METKYLPFDIGLWQSAVGMFLRSNNRKKDGKDHRYFSIVENHRLASNKTVQRTVLYLGEINDQQQAAWRKTLAVFDEEQQEYANLSLFPDDREIPADAGHTGVNPNYFPQADLNEAALRQTLSRAVCQRGVCEGVRLGHKEMTYDPPSQNDARGTRAS